MEPIFSEMIRVLGLIFGFPIIVYLTGMAWNKTVGAPQRVNKIWASFCLLFPIVGLSIFVQGGGETLRRWWVTSPYLLSFVTLIFGMLAPAGLIVIIVRLWRTKSGRRDR